MQLLATLSAFTSLTLLSPTAHAAPTAAKTPDNFTLKVKVLPGPRNQRNAAGFDGQYISTYHVGAGISDLVLGGTTSGAMMQLNATSLQIGLLDDTPWLVGGSGWSGASEFDWIGLKVSPTSSPMTGFSIEGNYLSAPAWGLGFRVCDWWHEVPQLFMLTGQSPEWGDEREHRPSSCSDVRLLVEAV